MIKVDASPKVRVENANDNGWAIDGLAAKFEGLVPVLNHKLAGVQPIPQNIADSRLCYVPRSQTQITVITWDYVP